MPGSVQSPARARARAEWQRVADRLATVTPRAAGRVALGVGVALALVQLTIVSWPALVPFLVGAGIAYAVLPIVDLLDPVMPRAFAAVIAVVAALAIVIGAFAVVLPVLARAVAQLATELPSQGDIDRVIAELQSSTGGLPPGTRDIVSSVLVQLSAQIHRTLEGASGGVASLALEGVRALVGVVAIVIGLIALPTWVLTVLRDREQFTQALDRRMPPGVRADAWAVVRIADRAGRAYLRGAGAVAVLVGLLTYAGLAVAPQLGVPTFVNAVPIAVFAGIAQLIPSLGVYLGFTPALLILVVSPERAIAYLVAYGVAVWLGAFVIGSRVGGPRLHPVLLVPGIVALSEFGLGWLILAGPLLAIAYDLVRYVHGRLSEPPRPAGLLPGDPAPAEVSRPTVIPSVYLARRAR